MLTNVPSGEKVRLIPSEDRHFTSPLPFTSVAGSVFSGSNIATTAPAVRYDLLDLIEVIENFSAHFVPRETLATEHAILLQSSLTEPCEVAYCLLVPEMPTVRRLDF
ncbi:MAG TPA: hypothetical protein DEQ47_15585 [Solibacterales bacterium]|nr:hypothetical protein [Bryobacterales bacterium]